MTKSTFAPMRPARRGTELLQAIGQQLDAVPSAMPSALPSESSAAMLPAGQVSSVAEAADQPPKPAPFVLRLSPDVFRQVDARAVADGVTMTVIIARALVAAGFFVPEDDLKDRRKRRYRG